MSLQTKRRPATTSGPSAASPPAQGGLGAFWPQPQQTPAMTVNLVNDGQKSIRPLALAPVDFINPDGPDPLQDPVRQAPLHKPLDRAINAFPTGAKGPRRLPPRQSPRPAGQKTHHGDGDRSFAIAPGNVLDNHPMLRAVDPPGGIEKPRHDPPQRNKQPGALLQVIITGGRLETEGTFAPHPAVRRHRNLDLPRAAVAVAAEPDILINESRKMLNGVQEGLNLQLNSWSPFRLFALPLNSQITRTVGDQLFLLPPWTTSRRLWAGAASGGDGLPNSCSRRRRSPRVTDSPAPAHRRAGNARTSITKSVKKKACKNPESAQNRPQIMRQTQHDYLNGQTELTQRQQVAHEHGNTAVARQGDDLAVWMGNLRADGLG